VLLIAWSDIIKLTNNKHVTFALYAWKWRSLKRHFAFVKTCVHENEKEKFFLYKKLIQYKKPNERKLTYRNFLVKHFLKRLCGYCFSCAVHERIFKFYYSEFIKFSLFFQRGTYIDFYAIKTVTILWSIRPWNKTIKFFLILVPFYRI